VLGLNSVKVCKGNSVGFEFSEGDRMCVADLMCLADCAKWSAER
jgi:hypothetical protein